MNKALYLEARLEAIELLQANTNLLLKELNSRNRFQQFLYALTRDNTLRGASLSYRACQRLLEGLEESSL